jgi:hypothetical protein
MSPPDPPKRPLPRPDALPRISPGGDQPDREAVRHDGVDEVPQAPTRKGTLIGMGATRIPGPPPLPREGAPTLPAAAHTARTQRAASPVNVQAVRIEDAPQGQPGPTLPPPSATAEEASAAAQRRDLERLQAERDQARAQLQLERLRAEEQAAAQDQLRLDAAANIATLQLEIERERTKQANAPTKPWIDERLVKALVALLTALAGLGVPLGIWLTAKATSLEHTQARQGERTKDATATAASAKVESSGADKELDELKQQLAAERSYNREVLRRMGVQIPKRPGDPDAPELKTDTPLPKPGKVSGAPVLVVTTPPP